MKRSLYILLTMPFLWILIQSCATPIGPTGGEPDRTPPNVVETKPAQGTVNFRGDEVSFTFDKFIDRSSFRQHVSIEPDLGIEFETSFSRRTATVQFNSSLPDNTTIVIKVGNDVSDTNRNRMGRPFDLALSTGPVLDSGTVTATVLDAETGKGKDGWRVFLYREPYDLTNRAIYTTETDTSGRVEFGYLGEGTYKAFWVNDINRNRIWDRNRELAQPFYLESFNVSERDSVDIGTLYVSMPDTITPRIEGVGLLSERRLRLRLSEEVMWSEASYLTVTDTLGGEITRAYPLYMSDRDQNVLFAESQLPLDESNSYTLIPHRITDSSGNPLRVDFTPFIGSDEPDTTILRTFSHNAANGLFAHEPLEIEYTKFIDDDAVLDSLQVVDGERVLDRWDHVEINRHILRISPNDFWEPGIRYQFRVWNPWEEAREIIEPEIWQRNQLGSIEFSISNGDPDVPTILKLTDTDNSIRVDTTFTGNIEIENLPPLTYKAILFQDNNGNGKWDPGVVDPFEKPEPYHVRRSIPVREGFTSEVEISYSGLESISASVDPLVEEKGKVDGHEDGEENRADNENENLKEQ